MDNLTEIQSQIEKLQKQADEIKSRDFDKTVKQILTMMEAFGITLKDLQQGLGERRKKRGNAKTVSGKERPSKARRKPSAQKGAKVEAKYRGPNGEIWSGRGRMPRWLVALVAAGKSKDNFAIKD